MKRVLRSIAGCGVAALVLACAGGDGPSSPATPQPVVTSVAVTPNAGEGSALVAGQTLQLSVVVHDQSGNAISASVIWSSSATNVATVTASGLVAAVAPGAVTITATATAGSHSVAGSFGVSVVAAPVLTGVVVTGAGVVPVGQSLQLTAAPRDQNGNAFNASVAWGTSDASIAAVSAAGLVAAIAPGSATITATATSGGATVASSVTVTVQATTSVLTGVNVSPPTSSLKIGTTLQLAAAPVDQNGAAIAATVTWSSGAPGVATVSPAGLVTGVSIGSTVITVQAVAGGTTVAATRTLFVTAATPVVTSVDLSAAAPTVSVGHTVQLTATARDQNGAAIAATYAWESSNTSRATVSSTGLVTGVASGAVTISVTATADGVSASNATTLTVLVLTSVTVTASSSSVTVGSTRQLTATPRDQNGTAIAGATVTWSSGATGVATVNGSGLVTGVSAGTVDITALATMGSATASAFLTITVNAPVFPASANVNTGPGNVFNPTSVDIAVNGSVTWNLNGIHNVTFDAKPGVPGDIPTGAGDTRTFNTTGTFTYQCTIHAGMTGTVVVH